MEPSPEAAAASRPAASACAAVAPADRLHDRTVTAPCLTPAHGFFRLAPDKGGLTRTPPTPHYPNRARVAQLRLRAIRRVQILRACPAGARPTP